MAEYRVINKPYPQIDAAAKVSGQRKYISDLRLPGMLWGHVLRSTLSHARIRRIDTEKALQVPGVKAVITAADTPQIPCGPFVPDWEILPQNVVRYAGQPVAAVAARDAETAAGAARLIDIEYEELPAILDPEEAMRPGAPLIHSNMSGNIANQFSVERGDVETAFRESDFVREETFYPGTQFHAYIEPNGAVAEFDALNEKYTLWVATQVPYKAWLVYSQALGIRPEKLRLIQIPMGGAFGGKFLSVYHLIAACLSKKAGKPVRLVNTFEEEFLSAPLRVPMKIQLKMGIRKDGSITAKAVEVIADNGAFTHWGPVVLSTACYRVDNLYRIRHTRSKGVLVYTNNLPKGSFRGFGQPQMLFAAEAVLDMLAEDAGIDPADLRLKNAVKSGDKTVHGWVIGSCGLSECIQQAREKSNWHTKRKEYSHQSGNIRRGIGLACCNHVSGVRIMPEFDGSAAMVKIDPDGRITVYSGEVDVGQGYNTVAAQCAAEELGVPVDWIELAPVDSQTSILGVGSLASRATLMGGNAVKKAAADAREKLLKAAAAHLNKSPETLSFVDGYLMDLKAGKVEAAFREILPVLTNAQSGQPFVGTGYYDPGTQYADPKTKYGNLSPAYPFGAHVAEVAVDLETAQVKLVNYVAANDVGKAINPLLVKGQLEGGIAQGMGYALSENLIIDNGRVVYRTMLDYKIPTFADMPEMEPVIVEEADANGPYGAKSVGEAAIDPVAAAICNAIYHAVGVRITRLPVRAETLLSAIQARKTD
jgi:CO/xanthine dehydrogenase Mo-binding subunit